MSTYSSLIASLLKARLLGFDSNFPVRLTTSSLVWLVALLPPRGIALPPIVCSAIALGPLRASYEVMCLPPEKLLDILSIWSSIRYSQSLYSGRQTVTPMQTSCVVISAACHIRRSTMVTCVQRRLKVSPTFPGALTSLVIVKRVYVGGTHVKIHHHWRMPGSTG